MKKLLLSGLLAGISVAAYSQGIVALNNADNANTASASATTNGLFFINTGSGPVLISQDFNAVFLAGTDAAHLTTIASFIGANAANDNAAGPGYFFDTSGASYAVPGVLSGDATFVVQAWIGNFADYASASTKGTSTFLQRVVDPSGSPPPTAPSLTGLASVTLSSVPEPGTFALAGLGAAALLIFRRRK